MFLRNFDHAITASMMATSLFTTSASASANSGENISVRTTNGSTIYYAWGGSNQDYPLLPFCYQSICIGNGTAPEGYDNYALSGGWTDGYKGSSDSSNCITSVSNTLDYDRTLKIWTRTVTLKYNNTSNKDRTISEWGIFRSQSSSYYWSNSSAYTILMFRQLLDEPVTVPANTTATLTFSITIPHETYAPAEAAAVLED